MSRKILVVDDCSEVRKLLCYFLRNLAFETVEACDGLAALELLRGGSLPDGVIVDWEMPRMNGLEFVEKVRSTPELNDLKIIMVSGRSNPNSGERALKAGVNAYMRKPVLLEEFEEKLGFLGILEQGSEKQGV